MSFPERLRELRTAVSLSQEQLALQLNVSRQAVAKWENGHALPDLDRAIAISRLYRVTLDSLFLPPEECVSQSGINRQDMGRETLIDFLLQAKHSTYAAKSGFVESSRTLSYDAAYQEGDYYYLDTYLGGKCFSGEEAVWIKGVPVWSMNYTGRVTGEGFSGDFLKEALLHVPREYPYRGPLCFQQGSHVYHAVIQGDFDWYSGVEEIFFEGRKVYECMFHGGKVE
jgi:transcriptional regulator with XRE-family HTH domain